ncbi:hypothetical protein [Halobellus rarus]|uniref:DUF8080 domain-containing protein n=1 Tax=Halobellus rarus TaxID=1126237 RepID=A0ABD6CLD7_9EURY|nr:hypothetical protein [Halobellus rarus]
MQTAFDVTDSTAESAPPVDGPLETGVSTTAIAGVTLVRVELRSTVDADLRVRVANELAGPVLPPRREGVPAAGWDADGFRGVVPASGRLGVGYACPVSASEERPTADSDPAREPSAAEDDPDAVSIDLLGPAHGTEAPPDAVATTIRSLGRAAPPVDAVPVGADAGSFGITAREATDPSIDAPDAPDALPAAIEEWLDAVESRVGRAERLTGASAAEATAVLVDSGGIDALAHLPESVAADESTLRAVRARVSELAERAAATDARPVVSSLSAAAQRERFDDATLSGGDRCAGFQSNGDRSVDFRSNGADR